jgi:hypothetical protein
MRENSNIILILLLTDPFPKYCGGNCVTAKNVRSSQMYKNTDKRNKMFFFTLTYIDTSEGIFQIRL